MNKSKCTDVKKIIISIIIFLVIEIVLIVARNYTSSLVSKLPMPFGAICEPNASYYKIQSLEKIYPVICGIVCLLFLIFRVIISIRKKDGFLTYVRIVMQTCFLLFIIGSSYGLFCNIIELVEGEAAFSGCAIN